MVRHVTANDLIFDVGAHKGRDTDFHAKVTLRRLKATASWR
jgi:hypothetical protein